MTKAHIKCLVHDCTNHTDEGGFVGNFCVPCYTMLTTQNIKREHKSHAALVEALEAILTWMLSGFAPQSQAEAMDKAHAALTLAKGA